MMKTRMKGSRGRAAIGVTLLLGSGLAACGDKGLLEVEIPGRVVSESLNNPALAQTLVNSALGRFECAYTSYVASSGILSGELVNASNWLDINPWGWRGVELYTNTGSCAAGQASTGLGAYTPLQQARYIAEEASRLIEGFADAQVERKSEKLGLLSAYAGYATLLLGEGFCEMAFDVGPLLTRAQVFQRAEERFSSAITLADAAGNANLRNMALTGRARARLNQGNTQGAATDAALIPEGFRWTAQYATVNPSRENRLFNLNRRNRYMSANNATYADLTVGGEPDTRVVIQNSGLRGHDNLTNHWFQTKYTDSATPITMASWEEAQLILAETRPGEAVAAINRLRAAQDLPAFEGATVSQADLVEERRRQLYLEGHRLNDMLRFSVPFPQGVNNKNQPFGPITCMPLPDQERNNNPNLGPR
jgi:starch-binding outer membrane protein, SusD/RagB family